MKALEHCKVAIDNLQKPECNQWLTEFFKTKESWEVCVQLLLEETLNYRFFGSISLYQKIQRDLLQLDKEHVASLLQTLINNLLLFSQTLKTDKSGQYVCLSVAAIAVQMNSTGIVKQLLLSLNPMTSTNPQLLLELLMILPEECFNYHTIVSNEFRDNFSKELLANISDILNFLVHFFSSQHSIDETLPNKILKCLENWILYTDIQVNLLVSHPIFGFIFELLKNLNTLDNAVDVLVVVCRKYELQVYPDLFFKNIIPHTLSLENLWNSLIAKIENVGVENDIEIQSNLCRSICRLATELAESIIDFQFYDTEEYQLQLLSFLVKCVYFRYDFTISRIPLKYFYEYSIIVHNMKREKIVISKIAETRIVKSFSALIECIVIQMELPNNVITGERKILDTTEDNRLELLETINDCALALGNSICVKVLCALLQRQIGSNAQNWSTIESILFASTAVISRLSREESHLCSEIIVFINTLPDLPGLKVTTVNLISQSAGWLRQNETYIANLLSYICNSLAVPSTMLPAAKCLASISKQCSTLPSFPKELILAIFEQNRTTKILSSESDSYVIESLCYVISSLPTTDQNEILECRIFNPILQSLRANLQKEPFQLTQFIPDIDAMSAIYRFILVNSSTVLMNNFMNLHQLLSRILDVFCDVERACEKVCRCYKYIIKCIGSSFGQLMLSMALFISSSFKKNPFSAFIYLAAILFSNFIHEENGIYVQNCYDMTFSIVETFLALMNSIERLEKRPDLVEELFYFIAKALEHCPEPLFKSNNILQSLIQIAIIGLQLKHRDSQKAVLSFFERLFEVAYRFPDSHVYEVCGNHVVKSLIHSLAGTSHLCCAVDENYGSITDTLWIIKQSSPTNFQLYLMEALNSLPSDNKKRIAENIKLCDLTSNNSKYEFSSIVKEFEYRCRDKQFI